MFVPLDEVDITAAVVEDTVEEVMVGTTVDIMADTMEVITDTIMDMDGVITGAVITGGDGVHYS
jgi:hypothetical protein